MVDFGIKLKLGKFWAKIGEKRCSKPRFSTTILLDCGLSNRPQKEQEEEVLPADTILLEGGLSNRPLLKKQEEEVLPANTILL